MARLTGFLAVVFAVFAVVFSSACIGQTKAPAAPSAYITPCNVVGENVLVRAEGTALGADIIKNPLAGAFVDDIKSTQTQDSWATYTLSCWWAKNVGEKRGRYYCSGAYVVPDLDERGVIRRYIRKNFKVGFDVESREGVSFVVAGKTHTESPYYLLTVKEVSATCTQA